MGTAATKQELRSRRRTFRSAPEPASFWIKNQLFLKHETIHKKINNLSYEVGQIYILKVSRPMTIFPSNFVLLQQDYRVGAGRSRRQKKIGSDTMYW